MEADRRKKCSGTPERKGGRFPHRPKGVPGLTVLTGVPKPTDPKFAELREFVKQRKGDAEVARQEHLERQRRLTVSISDAKTRRDLDRREAEIQRGIDDFWRVWKRKVRREGRKSAAREAKKAGGDLRQAIQLPSYSAPIRDRRGRIGMFMSATYLGAKTARYDCSSRLVYYVTNPDCIEYVDGAPAIVSNMGEDRYEMAAGMALVEDANRAARANAKVAVTIIVQLPHDVTPDERLRILKTWCEQNLAVHDLPYVAALHPPSAEGDQRNYHAHIVTSFRPALRVDRYEWQLGRAPRTDLDNPETFREMRRDFATIMTAVVQVAGKDRVYTHLSYAERGLKHKSGEHLGAHTTKLARAGEYVAANERNRRVIAVNQARERVEHIDQRMAGLRQRINRVRDIAGRMVSPLATIREVAMAGSLPVKPLSVLSAGRAADLGPPSRLPVAVETSRVQTLEPRIFASDAASTKRVRATSIIAQVDRAARSDVRRTADITPVTQRPTSVASVRPLKMPRRQGDAPRKLSSQTNPPPPKEMEVRRLSVVVVSKAEESRTKHMLHAIGRVGDVARPTRRPTALPAVSQAPVHVRSLSVVHVVNRVDNPASSRLRPLAAPIEQQKTEPRRPSVVETPFERQPEPARSLDIDMQLFADVERKVKAVKREQKEAEQALEKRAAAERAQREHANFIRYLGLIALNPHWIEDMSGNGLAPSRDMPPEAIERFDHWRPDHERLALIGKVRQGALDGLHRLPPGIAIELAAELVSLAPKVAKLAPPPLVKETTTGRRYDGLFETALAILAETPGWLIVKDRSVSVSPDAPPVVARAIELYAAEARVPRLLDGLQRNAGGNQIFGPVFMASIDARRASLARGRHHGVLDVIDTSGRLTAAMVDHLARLKLNPDWVVNDPYVGFGLSNAAPPVVNAQWANWSQPILARQLVLECLGAAQHPFAIAPAMQAQIDARAREIADSSDQRTRVHRLPAERDGPEI